MGLLRVGDVESAEEILTVDLSRILRPLTCTVQVYIESVTVNGLTCTVQVCMYRDAYLCSYTTRLTSSWGGLCLITYASLTDLAARPMGKR